MEILNIEALIAQGKILNSTNVDPDNDYLIIGKYQNGNRKNGGDGNNYPAYVIKAVDLAKINYKTYKAAFTLPDLFGNPVANILQNDLGFTPNWKRDGVGSYSTTDPFWSGKANKVFISTTKSWIGTGYINCSISEEDKGIILLTYDKTGILTDGLLADPDSFSRSYIEINVFD